MFSTILPGTYFLCGQAAEKNFHFDKQEVLEELGFRVCNPYQMLSEYDLLDIPERLFNKYVFSLLVVCDKVITVHGWENSATAKKVVDIARILNIEVISYSTFILKHTKN